MKRAAMSLAEAVKILSDLRHDFHSTPPHGFTLSQDDCHECARALDELLHSHNAFMEDHIAWQETREGMNRMTDSAELIAKARALAGEARAEVSQAAIGPIARPLVTRLAAMLGQTARALDACMISGARLRETQAALLADFDDCNSERARWKAKAEALR